MAFIRRLENRPADKLKRHEAVRRCCYSSFQTADGETILQINSYCTAHRQTPEAASQRMQFGREAGIQLKRLLNELYPD